MGVVLGIYLYRIGLTSLFIAFVVAAGLAGSALATILMSLAADRIGRKHFLVVLSLTSAVGGIALVTMPSLLMLAIMAFVGMLNGTGTDRSAAYVLDQAVIPGLAGDARRTWNLALYNLFLDGGGSLGALAAGLPLLLQPRRALSLLSSYRVVFLCVLRTVPNSRSALFASLSGGRDRERVNAHPLQR
jgi:MFS family permease